MFNINDHIGPYLLVRELGHGVFGIVWLARRPRGAAPTVASVAVKVPTVIESVAEAIARQARVWVEATGHPNVLPVLDAATYDGQPVLVSEYVSGGSLLAWLARFEGRTPPLDNMLEMACGIAAGLGHLHSQCIVHWDLKPTNILLDNGTPRLTDFGLARVWRTSCAGHKVMGTPAYLSPEAWDGARSEQSDIWSAGIVFYEMLAGRLPFPQTELMPLYRAIASGRPPPLPSTIPSKVIRIVDRCLMRDPAERFQTAAELLDELRRARAPTNGTNGIHHEASELDDTEGGWVLAAASEEASRRLRSVLAECHRSAHGRSRERIYDEIMRAADREIERIRHDDSLSDWLRPAVCTRIEAVLTDFTIRSIRTYNSNILDLLGDVIEKWARNPGA